MRMHTWRVLCLFGSSVLLAGCVSVPGNYYGSSLDPYCCGGTTVYYDTYGQGRYYDAYTGSYYGPYRQTYYPPYGGYQDAYRHEHDRSRGNRDHRGHTGQHTGRGPDRGHVATPRPDSHSKPPLTVFDPPPNYPAKPPPQRHPRDPGRVSEASPTRDHRPAPQGDRDSLPARLLQQQRDRARQQAQAADQDARPDARPKPDVRTLIDSRRR